MAGSPSNNRSATIRGLAATTTGFGGIGAGLACFASSALAAATERRRHAMNSSRLNPTAAAIAAVESRAVAISEMSSSCESVGRPQIMQMQLACAAPALPEFANLAVKVFALGRR